MDDGEMGKLEIISELLKEIDEFSDHPQSFYHRLLDAAIRVIDEAELGTVSLVRDGTWRYVAIVGHDTHTLLDLDLDADWEMSGSEVILVDHLDEAYKERFPIEIREHYLAAIHPARYSLIGAYTLSDHVKVVISVDIPIENDVEFSDFSRRIFESFVKLAGSYQRSTYTRENLESANRKLLRANEDLIQSYQEIDSLNQKLQQILGLTRRLYNENLDSTSFFTQLLQTALLVVDEARYGSVSVVRDDSWEFITAIGHDLDSLRELDLRPEWVNIDEGTQFYENILEESESRMPPEVFGAFQRATQPIGATARISAGVANDYWIILSLDIPKGEGTKFTHTARLIVDAFSAIARGFLKLRLYADEMGNAYLGFANKLAMVSEAHHHDTAAHNRRVAHISTIIAEAIGLDAVKCREIGQFASLHDIGKVLVDRQLLGKRGHLTDAEFEAVRLHTHYGERLLDDPWFATARNIALYHHERWDGSGYPKGLKGDAIPLEAQIVGVADVFDALRSSRSYKSELPTAEVLFRMRWGDERMGSGLFNPMLLDALETHIHAIECAIYHESAAVDPSVTGQIL